MKVIAPSPGCSCSVCNRSRSSSSPMASLALATPAMDKGTATALPGQPQLPTSSPLAAADASTSTIPWTPPASVRLPNELLEFIFQLARPPLPPATTTPEPLSLQHRTFAQLSLVHSNWLVVARQELARVVILRTRKQLRALTHALKNGWVGGKVEEILLEMKETASGKEDGSAQNDQAPDSPDAAAQSEQELIELLTECGPELKALRLRGFGDPALVHLDASIRDHLPNLQVFEYSPVDSAHPPSTANLVGSLSSLPNLKELVLAPSSRYLTPLREIPDSLVPSLTRLLDDLPALLLASPEHHAAYRDAFAGVGMHSITSLSLHSLALTPLTFLGLLFPSLVTLTTLSLSSTFFVGPSSTLFNLLAIVAPQLVHFTFEDKLINPVPSAAPPIFRHLGQSTLPDEQYWELLGKMKKLKSLKLFSPTVFDPCPARATFALPPSLEELSLGSREDDVADEDVVWWVERVEALLDAAEGEGKEEVEEEEVEEKEGAQWETDEEAVTQDEEESEGDEMPSDGGSVDEPEPEPEPTPAGCSDSEDGDEGGGEDDLPSATTSPRLSRASLADSLSPLGSGSPSGSDGDSLASTGSSPFSAPPSPSSSRSSSASSTSPKRAAAPSPPPPSAPPKPSKPPSPRRRRLSWRRPPVPPSPPTLRRLSLCTTSSALRDDPELQDRIDAVVARGVAVEWWTLVIVVVETLELTRELRSDMLRVPDEGV